MAIKPAVEGSSIACTKVYDPSQIVPAYEKACQYGLVIAEQWVEGDELTVGIVGEHVLPSVCIETPREFYDYEAKYVVDTTEYHCPSGLEDGKEAELRMLSYSAYQAIDCGGWGRVDVMQDVDGSFYLIEVNTTPGMTETSLLPKSAKQYGWSYDELCMRILEQTLNANQKAGSSEEAMAL